MDAISRLEEILDTVDKKADVGGLGDRKRKAEVCLKSNIEWKRYLDATTGKYYYHNIVTNLVTWDRPKDVNFEDEKEATTSERYAAAAVFSSSSSRWTGTVESTVVYDREIRQMSAYFDPATLEANRAEAKLKQDKIRKLGVDWKKYKAEKVEQKKTKAKAWLLEE